MDAKEMVVRQVGADKIGLGVVAAFLETEQIGPKGLDPGEGKALAVVPVIFPVVGQTIADIEAHHLDHGWVLLRPCRLFFGPIQHLAYSRHLLRPAQVGEKILFHAVSIAPLRGGLGAIGPEEPAGVFLKGQHLG